MLTLEGLSIHMFFFIATERKKRSGEIILLEKEKKEYNIYVTVATLMQKN